MIKLNLKSILKSFKLNENIISAILGILVVIVVGVLAINFFSKGEGETIPTVSDEETGVTLPTIHTVGANENLWTISEKYYGTGYNWTDIAQANNLTDPNDISEGDTLTIPDVTPRLLAHDQNTVTPEAQETVKPSATPQPKETPEEAMSQETKATHKVEAGETLWKIAEDYYKSGYNWVDIASANNLSNPGVIEVGQELDIPDVPAKKTTVVEPQITSTSQESISGASYTVSAGDNLWTIAVRAYGDGFKWSDIAKENNIANPGIIHPGDTLTIPR